MIKMAKNKRNKREMPLPFESKDINVYADQNQASEAEAVYISKQDPIERIKETVQLILRVFPLSKKKPNTNAIYIDKA